MKKSKDEGENTSFKNKLRKGALLAVIIACFLLLPIESYSAGLKTLNNKGTVTTQKDDNPMPPVVVKRPTKP